MTLSRLNPMARVEGSESVGWGCCQYDGYCVPAPEDIRLCSAVVHVAAAGTVMAHMGVGGCVDRSLRKPRAGTKCGAPDPDPADLLFECPAAD
jgi:hypothetical protein